MKKFLHTGERIKHLRMAMGLNQDDLTNDQLSKSLISMIEKNKRNLTWNTAHIIAESLNKYYKSTDQEITAEYLMETETARSRKLVKTNIEKLEKAIKLGNVDEVLISNTFEKTLELATEGKLEEELIELKMLMGNFYCNYFKYKDALQVYLDVFHHYMMKQDDSKIASMYITLGIVYQEQMIIDTAITHFKKAHEVAITKNTPNKEEVQVKSIFNQMICYRRIKRYDLVLNYVDASKALKWEDELLYKKYYNQILLLEANTYRDTGNYMNAAKLYDRMLLEEAQLEKETLFLLYENYALLHQQQGKGKRALAYMKKATEMKGLVNVKNQSALYLYKAECYRLLEEHDKGLDLLEHGLTLAEWISNPPMIIEMHFAFSKEYMKIKDFTKAQEHLEKAEETILEKELFAKKLELYSYYIDLYSHLGLKEKIKEYTNKLRPKSYLRY